ncbi:MAG: DUF1700 domain-containing protein [Clostridia bacterium]
MNKDEFLKELSRALEGFSAVERKKSIGFYRELLEDRMEEGMSEAQAVANLEPVSVIAARLREGQVLQKPRRHVSVFMLILATPFLIVVVAVVFALLASVWAVAVALAAAEVALIVSGVGCLVAGALRAFTMLPTGLVLMGAGLIVGGIGLLCAPLMRGLLNQMVRLSVLTARAMKHLIVGRERN